MKLKTISLSNVLKLELPGLTNGVIKIIEKHDPKYLRIDIILNLLKEQEPLMKLLEVPPAEHPRTNLIQQLREKELQCAGAIVSHMQFIERIDLESMRSAANIAEPVVIRYLKGLRKNNENVGNEIIYQFLKRIDKYPEVYDALCELGFKPFVDEIRKLNSQRCKLMSDRGSEKQNKLFFNSQHIQKECRNDLRLMFTEISLAQCANPHLNYEPLIIELNILITRYVTQISKRKTKNQKKAAKKSKKKTSSTSEETIQNETTPILLPNLIEALKLRNLGKT